MPYNTPKETAALAVETGVTKANLPVDRALVGGFLGGAYIAFGGLLAIVASAGLQPAQWGGLITLVTGGVFSLGLILVVIGGAELLTGNMALLPLAALQKRVTVAQVGINWLWITIGNLVGSLFVAFILADKTGVIGTAASKAGTPAAANFARLSAIAIGKTVTETHLEIFLRAIGCNWLVCLAVWLAYASNDVGGKILGIIAPITAFVALGFDHVVANMFFLPAALWLHVPGVTFANSLANLVLAYLGNALGAGLFVAGAYWFIYLRDEEPPIGHGGAPAGGRAQSGRRIQSDQPQSDQPRAEAAQPESARADAVQARSAQAEDTARTRQRSGRGSTQAQSALRPRRGGSAR